MRTIKIPEKAIQMLVNGAVRGVALEVPVCVDWPELRLTEDQVMANAFAAAYGYPEPYPDHSIFTVQMPVVAECFRKNS